MKDNNRKHLVCVNCKILLDCSWMGISIDYDDYCCSSPENYHIQKEIECDCESKVIIDG